LFKYTGQGGFGVDEATMVAMVTKWRKQPNQKSYFRRDFTGFFTTIGNIEKCEDDYLHRLKTEFSRFKVTAAYIVKLISLLRLSSVS
jgi:annexin D